MNREDLIRHFEEARDMEVEMLRVQAKVIDRPDGFYDIMKAAREFFGTTEVMYSEIREWQLKAVDLYTRMGEVVSKWKLEDFLAEEFEDPYKEMYPTMEGRNDMTSVFEGMVDFLNIRPFAERAMRLWQLCHEWESGDDGEDAED